MDTIIKYAPLLIMALQFVVLAVQWSIRKGLVTRTDYEADRARDGARIADLSGQLHGLAKRGELSAHVADERAELGGIYVRLGHIDQALAALPSRAEIGEVHKRVDQLAEIANTLKGTAVALDRQVATINRYLMEHGK